MNLSCKIKLLWNRSFLVANKNARFGKEKNGVVRWHFKQKTKIPSIKYRYASKYLLFFLLWYGAKGAVLCDVYRENETYWMLIKAEAEVGSDARRREAEFWWKRRRSTVPRFAPFNFLCNVSQHSGCWIIYNGNGKLRRSIKRVQTENRVGAQIWGDWICRPWSH